MPNGRTRRYAAEGLRGLAIRANWSHDRRWREARGGHEGEGRVGKGSVKGRLLEGGKDTGTVRERKGKKRKIKTAKTISKK